MASVLIIDDDVLTADAVAKLLEASGHEVRRAGDAGGAFRCLSQQAWDLILLDVGLPRVSGLDLLDALRDEPRFADIRIAVYSGRDEPETRATAQRLGAVGFIPKGQSWAATCAQIERCLGSDQAKN